MEIRRLSDIPHIILASYLIFNWGIFTHHVKADEKLAFDPKEEDAKIAYLIKEVKESQVIFVRNGDEHSAMAAADHLQTKMTRARKTFGFFGAMKPIRVETFIEKIASKSSMSGKPYQVKLPDGNIISTEDWLKEKLKSYPKKSPQ